MLLQVWQQKLSDLSVAHFPWEPTPTPSQPEPTVSNKKNVIQQSAAQVKKEVGMNAPHIKNGDMPRIKAEPGLEPQGITAPPIGHSSFNPQLAAIRAQQNIQQKFGGAAVPMLAQQQQQQQHQQQHQQYRANVQKPPGGGLMLPGLGSMQPQPQPVHPGHHNGIPQHDGADDDIPVEGFRRLTREEADRIVLRKINAAEKRNAEFAADLQAIGQNDSKVKVKKEGGKRKQARLADAYDATLSTDTSFPYPSSVVPKFEPKDSKAKVKGPSQYDGPGEVEDEDAINSDLDDPDEDDNNNDDDDESPQIMLCMYDKVQRTKNKWKCVLKDGVLTINGRE